MTLMAMASLILMGILLYDSNGEIDLPDYSQVFFDLSMKYKGFSAVIEYADSYASGIDELYVDQNASTLLTPSQISSFLVLGSSFNIDILYEKDIHLTLDLE